LREKSEFNDIKVMQYGPNDFHGASLTFLASVMSLLFATISFKQKKYNVFQLHLIQAIFLLSGTFAHWIYSYTNFYLFPAFLIYAWAWRRFYNYESYTSYLLQISTMFGWILYFIHLIFSLGKSLNVLFFALGSVILVGSVHNYPKHGGSDFASMVMLNQALFVVLILIDVSVDSRFPLHAVVDSCQLFDYTFRCLHALFYKEYHLKNS